MSGYQVIFGGEEEFHLTDEEESVWLTYSHFDVLDYEGVPAWLLADHLGYAIDEVRDAAFLPGVDEMTISETVGRLTDLKELAECWSDSPVQVKF